MVGVSGYLIWLRLPLLPNHRRLGWLRPSANGVGIRVNRGAKLAVWTALGMRAGP
jgi:hypothetical protein